MPDAIQIMPNIWLGNMAAALDYNFIFRNKINTTVNVTKINSNIYNLYSMQLPVGDSFSYVDNMQMYMSFDRITDFINEHVGKNNKVLIHCEHGISRSATVLAAYLIRFYKVNVEQSIMLIKKKKNNCFPNGRIKFREALKKYYLNLLKKH